VVCFYALEENVYVLFEPVEEALLGVFLPAVYYLP